MAILLILFFIGLPILLGIGLWKPQLVLRWETEPTKKKFLLYWFGITVVLFIIMVALTPIVFSIESNPKNSEITTLSEITFTGKGRVEAILTINSQPVKIVDKAYSVKFPLALGDNEFKIEYEFEGKKESKVIKVSRISEQEYKAQQNKIEAEKKLAAKKEEDETKKAELENKKNEEQAEQNRLNSQKELAKSIYNQSKDFVRWGFEMEAMRTNPSRTAECGVLMRNFMKDSEAMISNANSLPNEYIRLKAIANDSRDRSRHSC